MSENWTDQSSIIRKGEELDIEKLSAYLKDRLEFNGNLELEQFPNGFSNLTYLLKMGEKQMVLRRPPFGANIKSAHDMGREYKILSALSKSYLKAPKPYLYTEDDSIIGSPFYIMERVQGVILRPKMKREMWPDENLMSRIGEELVSSFAELHQLDHKEVGLGDLGKPDGYVKRQIEGWTRRYFKAKTDEVEGIEKAARWLEGHLPTESSTSLIHNDFKYDNLVLDATDWSKIIAVLDWEMATIGDPLMDLGSSLAYWTNRDDPAWLQMLAFSPTTIPGNPKRSEVAQMYAEKTNVDLSNICYYYVYGVFKLAVIAQQIYYRYKHGHTQDSRFKSLGEVVAGLGMVATQAIAKNRIDDLF